MFFSKIKIKKEVFILLSIGFFIMMAIVFAWGIKYPDSEVYLSQIENYRMRPVSVPIEVLDQRAFKPLYAFVGYFIKFIEPIALMLLINGLFFFGFIFLCYPFLRELGFDIEKSFWGTIFMITGYPFILYAFAVGTDLSGWFFCLASIVAILAGVREDKPRNLVLASLLGFLGATGKETGILGLVFGGIYLFLHFKDWGWKKTFKLASCLSFPFIICESILLSILFAGNMPNFLHWLSFNKETYAGVHTLKYFIGSELATFNVLWIFFFVGLFSFFKGKLFDEKEKIYQTISLFVASLPVLFWPIFLDRILYVQAIFVVPVAMHGFEFIDSFLEKRGWGKIKYALYLIPILASFFMLHIGGQDGLFLLRQTVFKMMGLL